MHLSPGLSDFLNLSRWIAAILVLTGHIRGLLFVDFQSIQSTSIPIQSFYFITSLGHEAVLLFFVMSGYLVGGKALCRILKNDFSPLDYAVDRISRIYTVYIASLLLTALLDFIGNTTYPDANFYNGTLIGTLSVIQGNYAQQSTLPDFLGNLLMLQTIHVPTFGSNGPLWSLSNECWYYLAGPTLFTAISPHTRLLYRLISLLLLAILYFYIPLHITYAFIYWIMGALFAFVRRGSPWLLILAIPTFLYALIQLKIPALRPPIIASYILPFSFLLLMAAFQGIQRPLPLARFHSYLANFSYSIYLIHFPVLILLASFLFSPCGLNLPFQLSPHETTSYLWALFLFVIAIAISWIISRFTEAKTQSIRAAIRKTLLYQWHRTHLQKSKHR
jgi:peptidoglycan/LPS O-acetylase OafA/YrhL